MNLEPRSSHGFRLYLAKLFSCSCRIEQADLPHPAKPNRNPPKKSGDQRLGPNQLAWCEAHFPFYGIHRRQAEAPTGVAVVPKGPGE